MIGREGKVVGVVAQLSAEAEGRLDVLGYGVVVPTSTLKQLLQAANNNSDRAERLSFKQRDGIITHGMRNEVAAKSVPDVWAERQSTVTQWS